MIAVSLCRNPRLSLIVVGLILFAGLASWTMLPRMEDPLLTQRVAVVTAVQPGVSAEVIESSLAVPLESELSSIPEIGGVRSICRSGVLNIVLELMDSVTDVDAVWSEVREKLKSAPLPEDVTTPDIEIIPMKAYATLIAIVPESSATPRHTLDRLSDQLVKQLRAIRGTQRIQIFGELEQEYLIEVDEPRANSMGVTPGQIAERLRADLARMGGGEFQGNDSRFPVDALSSDDGGEQLRGVPLIHPMSGETVPLGDITGISMQTRRVGNRFALIDGQPSVVIGAFVEDAHRIDHWTSDCRTMLAEIRQSLPGNVTIEVLYEQNRYVKERQDQLLNNLLLGVVVVMLVVLLMMGWWSTLIVSAALPLCLLLVLFGFRLLGVTIQQISVTGMIIALGLLIDNAIIMVHEVTSHLKDGQSREQAIRRSLNQLAMPLLGSTLTTALTFAPIALLQGPSGEFVGSLATGVILAITASLAVSLTIVPALAANVPEKLITRNPAGVPRGYAASLMRGFVTWSCRHPAIIIPLCLVIPSLGFVSVTQLPRQFFPPSDRDQILVEFDLPLSASIERSSRLAQELTPVMTRVTGVRRVDWFVGASAPACYYNMVPRRRESPYYAQAIVHLDEAARPAEVVAVLQKSLPPLAPDAGIHARQLEQGPPFDAPIEIRIFGSDFETLHRTGERIRHVLSRFPEVLQTRSDFEATSAGVGLSMHPTELRHAGLSREQVLKAVYLTTEGIEVGRIEEQGRSIPVRLRTTPASENAIEAIGSLRFFAQERKPNQPPDSVLLEAMVDLELIGNRGAILRYQGQRMNEVKAYLASNTLPSEVLTKLKRALAEEDFEIPNDARIEFGGEQEKRRDAVSRLFADLPLLVVMMLSVLFLLFHEARCVLIIGFVGMLSIGTGFFVLSCFDFPLGFMALVGTMGVFGVAINDAIVVLAALKAKSTNTGLPREDAVDVVLHCARHVIATSLTTLAAFVPLILRGGAFWPPVAITLAGGVGGATILALCLVPALFLITARRDLKGTTEGT